ncbi:MAG TPA: cupin domain-containing protein [Solirubrobacteraceae bacterium]|nr:cupin domain-containing protein [Solirubrobacteraceae bacterium]
MSDRPRPDLSGVRDAMRERDDAVAEPAAGPPPRLGDGPSDMASGVATTRIDFGGEERFQTLRRELEVSAFGINVLRLRPGQRSRIHRHDRQEEVYVVLEGVLSLAAEGEDEHTLERGGVARVAPGVRRQLTNRGNELLVVLAIGGAERHEGRDGVAYERWEDEEGRPPQEVPLPPDLPA